MKILITGATSIQIGKSSRYVSLPQLLRDGLLALGHKVEQREATPNDYKTRLASYHRVFVFIAPQLDLHTVYSLGAWLALDERPDAAVCFDDWQVGRVPSGARTCLKLPRYYFDSPITQQKKHRDEVKASKNLTAAIVRTTEWLASDDWSNRKVVMPLFPDHDTSRFKNLPTKLKITPLDPSSFVPVYVNRSAKKARLRHWVSATVGNHRPWLAKQGFSWPVDLYGHKAERLTEPQVMEKYAEAWGTVAPRYPHSGSGWWRSRYNFAAQAGCITYCDQGDSWAKLPAYALSPAEVEASTDRQLRAIAAAQRDTITTMTWNKQQYLSALELLLKGMR